MTTKPQAYRKGPDLLPALRIKYKSEKEIFLESSIERKEPFGLFRKWLQEACDTPEIIEPNAMCLATATK